MLFGVIGGTGFYRVTETAEAEQIRVETPYGPVQIERTRLGEVEIAFLARHGTGHSIPPHRVNYRANIAALKQIGVTNILASAAVGSLSEAMPPGSLAILTQFLDFTHSRASTFYDGESGEVVHVDMSDPYCSHLRGELASAADSLGVKVFAEATYVCAEGPRFETPAEIRMFRQLGGDLVGMTNVPEVVLAREAGLCYATIAVVTNWAAGVSKEPIKHGEVSGFMDKQTPRIRAIFEKTIADHKEIACSCRSSCPSQ